jgi:hypothetical protein
VHQNILAGRERVFTNAQDYFEAAAKVYGGFFLDNGRNLGGRVALADTNWKIQKLSSDNDKMYFRKARLLNLQEIDEPNNLFHLAFNNKIIITSIMIKE